MKRNISFNSVLQSSLKIITGNKNDNAGKV